MKIILLGAPGAGKGTYASRLKNIYNLSHISTGDLLRHSIKNQTLLGIKAKNFIEKGCLVPDKIVLELLEKEIKKEKRILIDGFPRTISQAKMLKQITKISLVLKFDAHEKTVLRRLSERRTCKSCNSIFHLSNIPPKKQGTCDNCGGELYQRPDDTEETIKKRLQIYKEQTTPLEEYYKQEGILKNIDANLDINDPKARIIEECQKAIDLLNNL